GRYPLGAIFPIVAGPAQHPAEGLQAGPEVGFAAVVLEADELRRAEAQAAGFDHNVSDIPPGSGHGMEVDETEARKLFAVGGHVVLPEQLVATANRQHD